jgi:adenosylhomocysteine nucleosidase
MTHPIHAKPVFIAALPREIAGLVNGWCSDEELLGKGIHLYWNDHAVIACAGMGASRAALAVEAALKLGPASELVSVGWAGACIYRLSVGDVVYPDIVVDVKTGERFFPQKHRTNTEGMEILVTVPRPAGTAEKERIAVSYYASAIDMEAAAVARLARARELPFQAIKAISDSAKFEIPDFAQFTTDQGHIREGALGLHVAMRPSLWKPVMTMARGSKLASGRLQTAIQDHIHQHRTQQR